MARKGENIYRRKDGRWEGRFIKARSADSSPKYGSVYGKSYGEVKKNLLEKQMQIKEQAQKENTPSGCFSEFAQQWLASASKNIKESTYNNYADYLDKHILPCLGVSVK